MDNHGVLLEEDALERGKIDDSKVGLNRWIVCVAQYTLYDARKRVFKIPVKGHDSFSLLLRGLLPLIAKKGGNRPYGHPQTNE